MLLFEGLLAYSDIGLFALRLVIALIFLYHAMPKLKDPKAMAKGMGKKEAAVLIAVLGLVEFVSAVALILGAFMQIAALLLGLVMLGTIFIKITSWGVPFSAQKSTGWEFDLLLLAANVAILFTGGGGIAL